jgi:hypothetical protein
MVRLNSADRDERIRAFIQRLGNRELELSNLVSAESEGNGVVSFGEQARSAAKRRSQSRKFLNRRWS